MTKTIMINSFRGGTGKSTIIANISYYMASLGYKVMLIDGDVVSPGIHTFFNLSGEDFESTLTNYLVDNDSVEDAVYDISDSVRLPDDSLLFIPSAIKPEYIVELLQDANIFLKLEKAINRLKKIHKPDIILIDSHPGITQSFLSTVNFTDLVFNVIRPDYQDYQGAKAASKLLSKIELDAFFIMNKAHSSLDRTKLKRNIQSKLHIDIAGVIPIFEDIIVAQSNEVITERYPEHPFTREIQKIVANVFKIQPKDHLEMMYFILQEIIKKGSISSMLRRKKVNAEKVKSYLSEMIQKGMIIRQGERMISTVKGRRFVKKYDIIKKFVKDFRL